jgi:hypothetical protein
VKEDVKSLRKNLQFLMNRKLIILCSLLLVVAIISLFLFQSKGEPQSNHQIESKPLPTIDRPEATIYQDEAMLKGSQAIIAGIVENISNQRLEDLTIELEMRRRQENRIEKKVIKLVPSNLAPTEKGRYSLTINSHEYEETKIVALKSGNHAAPIKFQTRAGAKRPKEPPPPTRTIIIPKRPKKSGDEEFLNTPDTPIHAG